MKITKRQLKRIIREEYTRLKRRGLINEHMYGSMDLPPSQYVKSGPQAPAAMKELKFFVKNIVETSGWETMIDNMEMYDDGAFVDYCMDCGCSSDAQFVKCALEYAEGMSEREIVQFTDYIAHYSGRYG